MDGERGSKGSVLTAQHDDDDDHTTVNLLLFCSK